MKNKGFTLVELIAVLALLALSMTMIIVNMQGVESRDRNKRQEKVVNKLETAACTIIDSLNYEDEIKSLYNLPPRQDCKNNNTGCKIPLNVLVKEGLIDEEEVFTNNKLDTISEIIKYYGDNAYIKIEFENVNNYKKKKCTCYINNEKCDEIINLFED